MSAGLTAADLSPVSTMCRVFSERDLKSYRHARLSWNESKHQTFRRFVAARLANRPTPGVDVELSQDRTLLVYRALLEYSDAEPVRALDVAIGVV